MYTRIYEYTYAMPLWTTLFGVWKSRAFHPRQKRNVLLLLFPLNRLCCCRRCECLLVIGRPCDSCPLWWLSLQLRFRKNKKCRRGIHDETMVKRAADASVSWVMKEFWLQGLLHWKVHCCFRLLRRPAGSLKAWP